MMIFEQSQTMDILEWVGGIVLTLAFFTDIFSDIGEALKSWAKRGRRD